MRLSYQGRPVRRSTDTTDRKLAEKIYHKVRVQIAEGQWFPRDAGAEKTVRDLLERYLREHSAPNKAPTTHRCDQSRAQRLIRTFGDLTLKEMRPSLLASYKASRRAEGAAAKTINHDLALLGHAFQLGMKEYEWVAGESGAQGLQGESAESDRAMADSRGRAASLGGLSDMAARDHCLRGQHGTPAE